MPTGVYPRPSAAERFWMKVQASEECWQWTGATDGRRAAYGAFNLDGRTRKAHAVAWEMHFGPIPSGQCVLHRCDVPLCVRPDHLFLGTKRQNSEDMVRKGRQAQGFALPHAKLSPAAKAAIREAYATGGVTQQSLASTYGVTRSAIEYVVAKSA